MAAAESGRLRVQAQPDASLLRRLDKIERRISRSNWSLIVAVLILGGVLFYVNSEQLLAIIFWLLALFILLGSIIR